MICATVGAFIIWYPFLINELIPQDEKIDYLFIFLGTGLVYFWLLNRMLKARGYSPDTYKREEDED